MMRYKDEISDKLTKALIQLNSVQTGLNNTSLSAIEVVTKLKAIQHLITDVDEKIQLEQPLNN